MFSATCHAQSHVQAKNGFQDTAAEAKEKFFLRVLMLTVRFDAGVTFGELGAEPETQKLWEAYAAEDPEAGEPKFR